MRIRNLLSILTTVAISKIDDIDLFHGLLIDNTMRILSIIFHNMHFVLFCQSIICFGDSTGNPEIKASLISFIYN